MAAGRSVFAYWTAVVMGIACVAIVAIHHSALPWKFEIGGVSLVWITAGAAFLAVLLYELTDSIGSRERNVNRVSMPEGHAESKSASTGENRR